jgi:hypothetical protein
MTISKNFFKWITEIKKVLFLDRVIDVREWFKEFFGFLDWVNEKINKDGLLSLEDDLHNDQYKRLVAVIGNDTTVIDRVITLFCNGTYGDESIPVWENFILYSVDSKERELTVLLVEAIHHIIAKDVSYSTYKSFWE